MTREQEHNQEPPEESQAQDGLTRRQLLIDAGIVGGSFIAGGTLGFVIGETLAKQGEQTVYIEPPESTPTPEAPKMVDFAEWDPSQDQNPAEDQIIGDTATFTVKYIPSADSNITLQQLVLTVDYPGRIPDKTINKEQGGWTVADIEPPNKTPDANGLLTATFRLNLLNPNPHSNPPAIPIPHGSVVTVSCDALGMTADNKPIYQSDIANYRHVIHR